MVTLLTSKIVGSSTDKLWSQTQVIGREDGQILAVVKLACNENDSIIELPTIGSEILAEVERKGVGATREIVENNQKDSLKIDLLIASLKGDLLSVMGIGGVEAYLVRDGQMAKLGNESQGRLQENDIVVFSTSEFVEMIGVAKLKTILIEQERPAELLSPLIHSQGETGAIAAIVGEMAQKNETPKMDLPKLKIYLRNQEPRKINLWIGGVILILLIIMIGVGMVRRVKVVAERDFVSLSQSVMSKTDETLSISDLNPERARILLSQSKGEVEAYMQTNIKEEYKTKAGELMVLIEDVENRAFKKNEISLNTVVELPVLVEGLSASKMQSDGKGNLVFGDNSKMKAVLMNLVDRSRQVIEKEGEELVDLGMSESKMYGLNKTGVWELNIKKDEVNKVIEPDEFWVDPKLIELFAGNVYVFDKGQSEIWKYPVISEGFGARRRWLAAGITPDLSNVVDMKVVGDVWLLTTTGKLERYSRGAPVSFSMDGFPAKGETKKLSEPSAIWVTDSLVYVLENGASRVVVFGSDGKYQSQYVNSEFARASDLVVVDDKGYVMIENVVKEFGL